MNMSDKRGASTAVIGAAVVIALVIGAAIGWVANTGPADYQTLKSSVTSLQSQVTSLTNTVNALKPKADAYDNMTKITKVKFRLDWVAAAQQSPWFLGKNLGYFLEEGIDLEIISGSGSADCVKEVAAKTVDFALCDTMVLVQNVVNNKMPIRSIAVYYTNTPISLIALKESGIFNTGDLKDIIGKKVGSKPGSATYQGLMAVCKLNNISMEKDIQLISVGFGVTPLLVGQCEVLMCFTMNEPTDVISQINTATGKNYEVNEVLISDWGVKLSGLTIIAHNDTLKSKPELAKALLRASIRSIEAAMASPYRAIAALLKASPDLKLARERMAMDKMLESGVLKNEVTILNGTGYSTLEAWASAQNVAYLAELITTKLPDANIFFTNEFLPK